jgi:imidazolonepropionase-like amidohydrolase
MKNILTAILLTAGTAMAQENMHPSPAQSKPVIITNATVHIGNGSILNNAGIMFENGKITFVGTIVESITKNTATVIDGTGKHIYPGLISPVSNLGLIEIGAVRATADFSEIADNSASVRSIVAYNTDSKVINTVRSNGVLLVNVVPQGGSISGSSSVVQLDAWNWEDAAYKKDGGIHYRMPALVNRPNQFGGGRRRGGGDDVDPVKQGLERIEQTRNFFREAKAYLNETVHVQTNLKYEAVKGLFNKTQTLFIHCDLVREMQVAMDIAKEFDFKVCIVGGSESWRIADALKQNNIAVILSEPHSLPATEDDAVDQPYKTGAVLQKAGVLFSICQDAGDGFTQQRNLPFQAGTMATYGLTKEEALSAITINAAKILGIDNITGTLENGKDANVVVCEGDILDMKSSKVSAAFIQGRQIDLNNKHTQLYEKYKYKYGIK